MTGVADPSQTYFKDGIWGYYSGTWVRLPLVFGFGGACGERVAETSTGGASTIAVSTAVPAGYIWVVQSAMLLHTDTVNRTAMIYITRGADTPLLAQVASHPPTDLLKGQVPVVLIAGDTLSARVNALVSGKAVILDYCGYKMAVT